MAYKIAEEPRYANEVETDEDQSIRDRLRAIRGSILNRGNETNERLERLEQKLDRILEVLGG